jgi:hypothetical protein
MLDEDIPLSYQRVTLQLPERYFAHDVTPEVQSLKFRS